MSVKTTIKNKFGTMVGWNKVTNNMLGRDIEGIKEIEYSDATELENARGAGKFPIGRGEGNYEAKCSIELYVEEEIALQRSLPPGTNLSDIPPFDITVQYEYGSIKYKDRIRNCQFKGRSNGGKQGDKTLSHKNELIPSHIDWNII